MIFLFPKFTFVSLHTLNVYVLNTTFDKNVWWFVAFVDKIVSSLVRLWTSFLRLENLTFQTLLKVSQDAFWTECVCSVGGASVLPCHSSVLLFRIMETSGLELKMG